MLDIIEFPDSHFYPYPAQFNLYRQLFLKDIHYFITIAHRRFGKTEAALQKMAWKTQTRVGNYWFLLPTIAQGRKVVWNGIDMHGRPMRNVIPKKFIAKRPHETDMLYNFKNGSTLQILGSDNYNSLMGGNAIGITLDEYSLCDPRVMQYIMPMIRQNKGWLEIQFTPRGFNHAFDLYEINKDNPEWYCQVLTVDDTVDHEGNPIMSAEDIEKDRRGGMSEERIRSEYYCEFNASCGRAYFAEVFKRLDRDNRILDFPINTQYPVATYWDLGDRDPTAIWLIQNLPENEFAAIYYLELDNSRINEIIPLLEKIRSELGIVYSGHFLPHDGDNTLHGVGISYKQLAAQLGLRMQVVPRITRKTGAIELTNLILPTVKFHKTNCKDGILTLRYYSAKLNKDTTKGKEEVDHNWASHGADAFMTFAQNYKLNNQSFAPAVSYRRNPLNY